LASSVEMIAWFQRLFTVLDDPRPGIDVRLNTVLAQFLELLTGPANSQTRTILPTALDRLMRKLMEAPEARWSAEDMARVARLSHSQLRRLFHQHIGVSPRNFLRNQRLVRAQRLMQESDLNRRQTARFGSEVAFAQIGIIGFDGQISVYDTRGHARPSTGAHSAQTSVKAGGADTGGGTVGEGQGGAELPCYACLFPPGQEFEEVTCATMGVFAPLVGIIGTMQAAEALKLLTGVGRSLAGRLLMLDGRSMHWDEIAIARQPHCPVCAS
jgi:molybdopterin/thiamine biosynthesis adenylyltransferase